MSTDVVALALLMAAVTYPSRALPLLLPGIERLPDAAHAYLRLIGPATLAALAAVSVLVVVDPTGQAQLRPGVESVAVLVALGVAAWRRDLLLACASAATLVALARAAGLAP